MNPSARGVGANRFPRKKHPAGPGGPGIIIFRGAGKKVLFCLLLVCGQALFFSLQQQISKFLFLPAVLPGTVLGILWHLLEGPEHLLAGWLSRRLDRSSAGFCLFFVYLIFYIALFSLVVSYPMGLLIGAFWGSMDLVREYALYSINPVFALVLFSWLQWWRSSPRLQRASRPGK